MPRFAAHSFSGRSFTFFYLSLASAAHRTLQFAAFSLASAAHPMLQFAAFISAEDTLFIPDSSPAQPYSFNLLLQPSAGDSLQLAIALSTANFASAQLHRYRSLLICLTRSNLLTASLSLMQLLHLNVLLNRLAGDILSRFKDFPDSFHISRPPGSLICSAGDYPSRPHCAHRLNDFQLMTFSSALHTTSELYLCMPSIYFLLLHSELPIASPHLRVFTFYFQTVVRLSQVSFSHATIFLPAAVPTTTDKSFKAWFCAPRCVNQRDFLSPSGETYTATIISCPSTLFVGYLYQFGIQFFFGRQPFERFFPRIKILPYNFQYFDDFAYAERLLQSFSKFFKSQLLQVIFICLSIFTLSTNIDCHFRRARIDSLTQIFLRVIQPSMRIVFGLGNERPSLRRAGSNHEDLSLSFFSSPSASTLSAILQFSSIFIFAVPSLIESSLVWAIKGRLLDALAHSSTRSSYLSFFAFELL